MAVFTDDLIDMVKHFEGYSSVGYQEPGDVPTVGWGHTGPDVFVGMAISISDAVSFLDADLVNARKQLTDELGYAMIDKLSDCQFSALTDFVFNAGPGTIADKAPIMHTLLVQAIRSGIDTDWEAVAAHLETLDYMGRYILLGLKRRRRAEALMLLGRNWANYMDYTK